jgi:phosphate transport system substrate-binding protein
MTISGSRILVASVLGFVATVSPAATVVEGAGATFPYPIYAKWFDAFHRRFPDFEIRYQAIGSEGGVQRLLQHKVDFAASDAPLSGLDVGSSSGYVQFPAVLGAVVPIYNVSRASGALQFTPEALAGIYLGTIRRWNDPVLKAANHGASLPDEEIVVVHRSDGSGTTYIWTDYLSKVSDEWRTKVGKDTSVNWPVGLGGKGNEGVAGLVKQTPNSIGYVELIYAVQNNIPYGSVKNLAGEFVKPSLAGVSAAAAGAATSMPDDFRVSITNAPGKAAYPISSFTWLLIPAQIQDAAKKAAIKDFLGWMMTSGQQLCEGLAYAKLPKEVIAKEQKAVAMIQ